MMSTELRPLDHLQQLTVEPFLTPRLEEIERDMELPPRAIQHWIGASKAVWISCRRQRILPNQWIDRIIEGINLTYKRDMGLVRADFFVPRCGEPAPAYLVGERPHFCTKRLHHFGDHHATNRIDGKRNVAPSIRWERDPEDDDGLQEARERMHDWIEQIIVATYQAHDWPLTTRDSRGALWRRNP